MPEVLRGRRDTRKLLDLPSPHIGFGKINGRGKYYSIERIERVPVFIECVSGDDVEPLGTASIEGQAVPFVLFGSQLYRRIVKRGKLAPLDDVTEVGDTRLIALEGMIPPDWFPDHPLAAFIAAWEAEALAPLMRTLPGPVTKLKEPKFNRAVTTAALTAQGLILVDGEIFKSTYAPGAAVQVGERGASVRSWPFERPYDPFTVYLPIGDDPIEIAVHERTIELPRRIISEPDEDGAWAAAMSQTLAAVGLTVYRSRRTLSKELFDRCRLAFSGTLANADHADALGKLGDLQDLLIRSGNRRLIAYGLLLSELGFVAMALDSELTRGIESFRQNDR